MVKQTTPSSDSAQFILAWQSEDSVESAGSSQSQASQAMVAAPFQERHKVVAVKVRRKGNHLTSAKLCKASSDGEEMM